MIKIFTILFLMLEFTLAEFTEPFQFRVMATTNVSGETDPCG